MCNGAVWPAECNVPQYSSIINSALFFRHLPAREAVKEDFRRVLLPHLRFTSLAKGDGTWEPTIVDPEYHFVAESAVADANEARRLIEGLVATDLDHSRPLWRVHLIPVEAEGDLSALLWRMHHCLGDGPLAVSIFAGLARGVDGTPAGETPLMRSLADTLAQKQKLCGLAKACRSTAVVADAVMSFLSKATTPLRPLETETKFSRPRHERRAGSSFGGERRVVCVPPHSLAYVKACQDAAHCALNDIVLSATSGALRRYCQRLGDPAFGSNRRVRLRALMPMATPHSPGDDIASNSALVSCRLAVSEAGPLERLERTSAELSRINSAKALVSPWQGNRLAKSSERRRQKLAQDLFSNHSLVFSNVTGPDAPVYIAGEQVEEVQAIFPNFSSQAIALSYNGRVHMSFTVDPGLIEDAGSLADCYLAELRAVGAALGVPGDPLPRGPEASGLQGALSREAFMAGFGRFASGLAPPEVQV